jgi:hypothetical protein
VADRLRDGLLARRRERIANAGWRRSLSDVPHLVAAHERAAASHDRAAVVHEQAAELYDGMGSRSMARQERARARLDRDCGSLERELARLRRLQLEEARRGPGANN